MAQQNNYKKNSRNSGRRKPYGNKKRTDKDMDKEIASKPQNDPEWYSKFPQLVNDTSNLFFSNPLGSAVERRGYPGNAVMSQGLDHVPGMVVLDCIATPGHSADATSPLNALARSIYSFIRHANSGHSNYDAPDLMMYLLAMDNCYSFWAALVRAYGVARYFSIRNRYLATEWLSALGFNPSSILTNLAQFRAFINTYATKLGSYAVPSSMSYFKRHTDMYTKIFLDEPSEKAQAYAFRHAHLWKLVTTELTGTQLQSQSIESNMTFAQAQNLANTILNPIIQDEDMNIMSGDILKAYGIDGIFKIPMIPEEYFTPFVFDMTVLSQIENSMATGTLGDDVITQDPSTGVIIYKPKMSVASNRYFTLGKLLNLHHDNPTPMDIMEATRLMYNVTYDSTATAAYFTGFGAELVHSYSMYSFMSAGGFAAYASMPFTGFASTTEFGNADLSTALTTLSNLASFNYHPRMTLWMTSTNYREMVMDVFDLDNYTGLSDDVLDTISQVAMLSLFDVGRIALTRG